MGKRFPFYFFQLLFGCVGWGVGGVVEWFLCGYTVTGMEIEAL